MKKIHEEFKKFLESNMVVKLLSVVGILLVAILIFTAGMVAGYHKAAFGRAWGEHYEENFGMGRRGGFGENMPPLPGMGFFPNAHGAIGKIIKIELPTIIVQDDKDNTEKVIVTTDDTGVEKIREFIKATDLAVDDYIVVIGSPNNQGQIEAKFIRVIPSPGLLNNKMEIHVQ